MRRRVIAFLLLALLGIASWARGADAAAPRFQHVAIAPAKTSIYIGTVSLTMPTFARTEARYESRYVAKVFPFFFYNEAGRLAIEVSDEQLAALARGETIEFTGRGVRDDGTERRIEGKATPADATSGKVKVRVFVSPKIELIFNTTYRFAD